MQSDFFTKVMREGGTHPTHSGWSITGLDLLFPDAGSLDSSTETLEERIKRVDRIIRRWWGILDGKSVDTWDEVGDRRRGVLREMGYQRLASLINEEESLADRSITADDLALYERELCALEKASKLYLLGVHRYEVEEGRFLDADAPILASDPEEQSDLDQIKSADDSWSFNFGSHIFVPNQSEATGTAEWKDGQVKISFDSPKTEHIPDNVWVKLKEMLEPDLYDSHLDSVKFGEEPEVWQWSIERPARANPAADIRRHCDDYWKCCLELQHLAEARKKASKTFDQERVAQFVWKSRANFLERFLLPAQNLARQPLEQRISERECLLVAGWIAAVSKHYPRQTKALTFEHGNAYQSFFIELPGAVISAISGDLNVKEALQLYQTMNNSITNQLDRGKFEILAVDVKDMEDFDKEDFNIEEVGIERDDFARAFTDVETQLRAAVKGAKLSKEERAVIKLILEGYDTNIEIAEASGKSTLQIGVEKKRAFDKIRDFGLGSKRTV